MSTYQSGFAQEIEKFVSYRKASGTWNEYASAQNLKYFDRYCADNYTDSRILTQDMIDTWCAQRDTETSSSCYIRTLIVREFVGYLYGHGMTGVAVPKPPKLERRKYIPHAFTDGELARFFEACDSIVPYKGRPASIIRKLQCPVFFRLLYSSGMRTTEARYLKRTDVDLEHGVVNIRKSKGYDQHYIALHDTMTELLIRYDEAVDKIQPGRTYFFESLKGKCYGRDWVNDNFKKIWESANGAARGMVPYDMRHHYAVENISSWEDDSFTFSERLIFQNPWGTAISSQLCITIQSSRVWQIRFRLRQRKGLMRSYRRCGMKKTDDAPVIARRISEFLCDYAPQFLTGNEHTLKGYKDSLVLYFQFLQENGVSPECLSRTHLEKEWIERWIAWLKDTRKNSPDTCNNRLASLRMFLEYLAGKDISMAYLYQNAKRIKRQKCAKKKVSGLIREAVTAMLAAPDTGTRIGRRDLVFLTLLYATAARLDEIRSIKLEDIHLESAKPYITLHGKGQKIRTAYLLPRAVVLLIAYIKEACGESAGSDSLLFPSRVDGHGKLTEAALDKRIKIYAAKANDQSKDVPLNTHAHLFRHAKASHWIEDGLSIVEVQFLLGHEQIETTMKYLDITTEEKTKVLATLESETERKVEKKWKGKQESLIDFCGLKR